MASSGYWDDEDLQGRKSGLKGLLGPLIAIVWCLIVTSVTYLVMLRTGVLPEEMRIAAIEQIVNPGAEEEVDPEDLVKSAGIDPENLAMLAMAAQTMGATKLGAAADEVMDEYGAEAMQMAQHMDLKGGNTDLLALVPADMIDNNMTRDEALSTLSEHAAAMEEMQSILEESGYYEGPVDGMEEIGDLDSVGNMMTAVTDVVEENVAQGMPLDEAASETALTDGLTDAGFLENPNDAVKSMTEDALQTLLDKQEYTVPMLDLDSTNIDRAKSYAKLAENPEEMLGGDSERSLAFIKAYMLPHTLLTDAMLFREAGENDRALNALRLIFLAFPDHTITGDALLLLSDLQDELGESEKSQRALHTFLTSHGTHPRIVDGIVRFSDWQINMGEGLEAACSWLNHTTSYPPAVPAAGLKAINRAAELRGCVTADPLVPDLAFYDGEQL